MMGSDEIVDLLAKGRQRDSDYREFYSVAERFATALPTTRETASIPFPAMTRNVGQAGGSVFQWNDLLELDKLGEALIEGPLSGEFFTDQLAKIAVALWETLLKFRRVQVPVDENEFKVLIAIRRGHCSVERISEFTGLPPATARGTVEELITKEYNDKLILVEVQPDGALFTRF